MVQPGRIDVSKIREEYLSDLTPAERIHEDGLDEEYGWVLDENQQPRLVKKPKEDEDDKKAD